MANEPIVIRVCVGCFTDPDKQLRHTLTQIQDHDPGRIQIVQEDCLDVCENDPVIKVGEIMLAPATPQALREAVGAQ